MLTTVDRQFNYLIAQQLQIQLSKLVRFEQLDIDNVSTIVATDIGYKGVKGVGVAVAYDVKNKRELCHIAIVDEVDIPYVPGLLAYREAPLMIGAVKELTSKCIDADVIMVNGHGISHPRRFGIASHIGVVLDKPAIGVAKKLLYGSLSFDDGGREVIIVNGVVAGYVLRGLKSSKIYVSVGHRITPENTLAIVERVWNKHYPLPDPLYIADNLTKKLRSKI